MPVLYDALLEFDSIDDMTPCQIVDADGTERCTCDCGEILGLLADDHRRAAVAILERADVDRLQFDRLLGAVCETLDGVSAETAAIELRHVHLPALEDRGLLEYDERSETIQYYHCRLVSDVLDVVAGRADGPVDELP